MDNSAENRLIRLGEQEVSYLLKRSRRRSIGLRVDVDGLTVQAPLSATQKRLDAVLRDKAGWVLGKLTQLRANLPPEQEWQDGAALPFLGGQLRLTLLVGPSHAPFVCGDELVVGVLDEIDAARLQKMLVAWYQEQAMQCLRERVGLYVQRLDLAMPPFKLSNAATRWGSCNARGELRFNWRLIKAPLDEIDYVVAHELAHIKHLDHSAAFWRVVSVLYPEYQASRAALRKHGTLYHAF